VNLPTPNPTLNRQNSPHWPAILILAAFILLAVGYSLATPPFEAGDESRHYAVVKYMADTASLPLQQPGEAQIHWSHEGNQPPLYYALAAALTGWIDTGAWDEVFHYNPHTTIGNPLRTDNKNITLHPLNEGWPWRGAILAVHLSRFLSILMAAGTVWAGYLIALRLFNGHRWLAAGAMAITAFNPMFIFIAAAVNNDNAVILLCTLTLYHLTTPNERLARQSPLRYATLLGLLIGLGALSKLYAFGLLPLAGLRLVWLAWPVENRPSAAFWKRAILWNIVMAAVFLLVAGWFYARNAALYHGDVLALQVMRETAGQRASAPSLATLRAEFEGFRIAYWALFGGVNILIDSWIYTALDWLSLLAAGGALAFIGVSLAHRRNPAGRISRPTFIIMLGWYLMMLAGFVAWNITQPAGQGRLLYPAITVISAFGMLGLSWWLPARGQTLAAILVAGALFLLSMAVPVIYIAPVYAKPPLLSPADLPADLQPVNLVYDDAVRLIGYRLPVTTVRPAETLPLTLYWQLLKPVTLDYSIFVHLLGRQRQVIGQIDSYPGGGQWPTTGLAPGQIVADSYAIPIVPEAEFSAPSQIRIAAGIYNYHEPGRPGRPAINAAGAPVEPIIGSAKLIPWQWPAPLETAPPVNFFNKATLTGYQFAADGQAVTLSWQVAGPFETDYTVFLQAWRADTHAYAAGFDSPPVQGDYPTRLWSPGEVVIDTHPLDRSLLPPGRYYLLAGLYHPATGERLPAFGPDGPLPDYAVNLGEINVD
jgi:4-amino-4-deoxy-L-arabinose transferase-like glycosyltransferase